MNIEDNQVVHTKSGAIMESCNTNFMIASELARQGLYDLAKKLLEQIPSELSKQSAILDLKARISAQQGNYKEAEKLWHEALMLDSSNKKCQEALNIVSKERNRPTWFHTLFIVLNIITILAIIYLAILLVKAN